jgi:hypothetical protein
MHESSVTVSFVESLRVPPRTEGALADADEGERTMEESGARELQLRGGDDLIWREIDGQVVVLDGRTWDYISVNETGRGLWDLLVEGTTRDVLVAFLLDNYEVSAEAAEADVDVFLAMLRDKDLLQE